MNVKPLSMECALSLVDEALSGICGDLVLKKTPHLFGNFKAGLVFVQSASVSQTASWSLPNMGELV